MKLLGFWALELHSRGLEGTCASFCRCGEDRGADSFDFWFTTVPFWVLGAPRTLISHFTGRRLYPVERGKENIDSGVPK